jgi:single-strand DNA-binding protein
MNTISISGRLTADPEEMASAQSNKRYVKFTVAVYRDKQNTDFFRCVAWDKTADFVCQFFKKGRGIEVCGPMTCRKYEDKQGNKRESWEVSAKAVSFPVVSAIEMEVAKQAGVTDEIDETDEDESLPF